MTATAITLIDFAAAVHATVPPDIHPAARATIHTWLSNLMSAAGDGDATTVATLTKRITNKVAQEMEWEREGFETPVGRISAAQPAHQASQTKQG